MNGSEFDALVQRIFGWRGDKTDELPEVRGLHLLIALLVHSYRLQHRGFGTSAEQERAVTLGHALEKLVDYGLDSCLVLFLGGSPARRREDCE